MLTQQLKLSLSTLKEIRTEMWVQVEEFAKPAQIKQLMGMLSTQIYGLCSRWDVFAEKAYSDGRKLRLIDAQRLKELAAASLEGLASVSNTVLWTQDYLKEHWPGAYYCPKAIRAMRHMMARVFKLFSFTPGVKGETVAPPELEEVNLIRMLLLYELLERRLIYLFNPQHAELVHLSEEERLEGGDVTFQVMKPGELNLDCLPPHRGALIVQLFNTLFGKFFRFHREQEVENLVVVSFEDDEEALDLPDVETIKISTVRSLTPTWKPKFKLSQPAWQTTLNKMWNALVTCEWLNLKEEELLYPVF